MSRSTQFIGLNKKASEFVETLIPIVNPENKTFGMFDEEIPLGSWKDLDGNFYVEVEQCSPWSSGPVILTALKKNNGDKLFFEWVENSEVKGEVDYENGEFYI